MKVAKALALLGCVIMAVSLVYGFTVGDFNAEGGLIAGLIWGKITLVDIYLAFALICGWIVYREASWLRALPWIVGMIVLGSFTGCLYTYLALRASNGDWRHFWMGRRGH